MNSPIGVFDSGLGGLSVAARLLDMLPSERILYFADNAHVPYGERSLNEIRGFAVEITGFLIGMGAKAVVMACNMSSAVALDDARRRFPDVPVLGMIEPGSAAAVRASGNKPIGVLATTGTVRSEAYPRTIARLAPAAQVLQKSCPGFVPLVEAGLCDTEEAANEVRACVEPLVGMGCRTLVLGCTHYPFLRKTIEAVAGADVTIVDPAEETVRVLGNELMRAGISGQEPADSHQFLASGDCEDFAVLGSKFLGRRIEGVRKVRWGVELGMTEPTSTLEKTAL